MRIQLGALTLARLVLNTSLRMVYPFAPAFARGLDVPVLAIYQLVTLRNAAGFLSPFFGPLTERYGHRVVLMGAMLLFSLGGLVVVIWPTYWALGVALVVIALSKVAYDPAMQAYVGDLVPYRERGRAIAVTEYSWALALLLGAPFVGFLIARQAWWAPFLWLSLFALAGLFLLGRFLLAHRAAPVNRAPGLHLIFHVMRQHPVVWAAILYVALAMTANEMLFIVYGDWMEGSFQLSLTSLGVASGVIGGAEILGETLAGWSVDRFGKRPVIIATGLLNAALYAAVPFSSGALAPALVTLFLLFLFFEITIVGGVPLMTELVPQSRGVVMSIILAAMFLGRTLGSFFGPIVWNTLGFTRSGLVWGAIMLSAVVVLALWVREGE